MRIELFAIGNAHSSSRNGYYTWARFGCDAALLPPERSILPAHLRTCRTLNELMLGWKGAEWWKRAGSERTLIFDLRAGSSSWRVLHDYLQQRGFTVADLAQ